MTENSHRDDGFALITALWAALILALLVSYIVVAGRTDLRAAHAYATRARMRAAAEGLLELTKLTLLGTEASKLPLDGTPITMRYEGYAATVTIQDQAGLIDLNFATDDTLYRLLTIVGGMESMAAHAMTDRILDWREHGPGHRLNGAKAPEYAAAGFGYGPREARFESVAEMKMIMGMTPSLYKLIAPALTVSAQRPVVDTRFAPASVLLTLPGMTDSAVASQIADRTKADDEGRANAILGRGIAGGAISINVRIGDQMQVSAQVAIRVVGGSSMPFWTYQTVQ